MKHDENFFMDGPDFDNLLEPKELKKKKTILGIFKKDKKKKDKEKKEDKNVDFDEREQSRVTMISEALSSDDS